MTSTATSTPTPEMSPEDARKLVDDVVKRVAPNKEKWANTSVAKRLEYLYSLRKNIYANFDEWAESCTELRNYPKEGGLPRGESFLMGPGITGAWVNAAINSLETLKCTGKFPVPISTSETPSGRKVAQVGPKGVHEKMLGGPGFKLELYLAPGKEVHQGDEYKAEGPGLRVALGGGNFEVPFDILNGLFFENKVHIYKPNPVNIKNAVFVEKAFAMLIEDGFLAVLPGGVPVATALINHPDVDDISIIGSSRTYNAIVWGTPDGPKSANAVKACEKNVIAELGNCSPWIVCPGNYDDATLEHQAAHLAATKMANSGHICVSPQIVLTSKNWKQREQFLQYLEKHLSKYEPFPTYYPGCDRAKAGFAKAYEGQAREIDAGPGLLFVPDISESPEYAMQNEAFGPVLTHYPMDVSDDPAEFLKAAVDLCNNEIWGTLATSLIVDDKTMKDNSESVRKAIDDLRYGSIGVNQWGGNMTAYPAAAWGAHPGHTPEDVQSGLGKMGNFHAIDNIEKSVVWSACNSPSHQVPAHMQKNQQKILQRMGRYMVWPSNWALVKMVSAVAVGI
eukprot:TRINITY_DN1031_c1_g1_i1.p1 TRINITY_DN1031_c1_g1~~TRINITY_DN1031_c1_g1_i1.p1  ORF type:complete len:572 (+),score=154.91 TRINITY_DN1031_c1_g1_i1:27-1718(+)